MSPKTLTFGDEVARYAMAQAEPMTPAQRQLVVDTRQLGPDAIMQVPHDQAVLLTLLTKLVDARTVVEVGTFTGYSTLALALGLAPGGRVITCDVTTRWQEIAVKAWTDGGVRDRIRTLVGPAAQTLRALPAEPVVDLVFLDADKVSYIDYWELLVPRVRAGGLLLADNVLYEGEAADPAASGNAKAIREFNAHVRADERVESVLLTVADGLTVARKKP